MKNKIIIVVVILILVFVSWWMIVFDANKKVKNEDSIIEETYMYPKEWADDGIFKAYYDQAYNKLQTMTLDEKIGQMLLVRYPKENQLEMLEKYNFGGFVFFSRDFKNKTADQVKAMTRKLQENAKIPLLTAVDEEGGSVVRISSNSNLAPERFKSPSELYELGGFELIHNDTISKSELLLSYGLNLNLAPVVDVAINTSDYMYERTLKQNTELTAIYAKTVIEASKGTGVSYTLKHFPGYADNLDTHMGSSVDKRSFDDIIKNDLPPFEAGITAGAEAVMVSHNVVRSLDNNYPASLSIAVHDLLRNELNFTGVIVTDDISMGALDNTQNVEVKAVLAGNNLIITTDFEKSFMAIKEALQNNQINENEINYSVFKILAWKYYKGLMSL